MHKISHKIIRKQIKNITNPRHNLHKFLCEITRKSYKNTTQNSYTNSNTISYKKHIQILQKIQQKSNTTFCKNIQNPIQNLRTSKEIITKFVEIFIHKPWKNSSKSFTNHETHKTDTLTHKTCTKSHTHTQLTQNQKF